MGNISSQIGNSSQKYKVESDGQLSLPRIQSQQPRVLPTLPSKDARPKLRTTENGKILHDGGTLTGRQQLKTARGNYMNVKEKVLFLKELHENNKSRTYRNEQLKKSGSEPDLRYHLSQENSNHKPKKLNFTKKVSQWNCTEKRSSDLETWENIDSSTKRIGLFKTRIESKKQSAHIPHSKSPIVVRRNKLNALEKTSENRRSMPELQKVAALTDLSGNFKENEENVQCLDMDINILSRQTNLEDENQNIYLKEANVKKYYFGMTTESNDLEYKLNYNIGNYESNLFDILSDGININSSNNFEDDSVCSQKISLQLRPILPKKQLEIPKFSSDMAWKLLYSGDSDSNLEYSISIEDDLIEDKIEKVATSPLRLSKSIDFQFSQDKSGDSGISGDETPKPTLSHYKSKQSWTPQQDLGDDSSTDEEIKFNSVPYYNTNKPHVFSLSLPREHLTSQYTLERYNSQSHLQSPECNKLKRSICGGFGNNTLNNEENVDPYATKNCNWLLSKSAPNSLNNGFTSLESAYMYDETSTSLVPVSQHNKGRIMYLPNSNDTSEIFENHKKLKIQKSFQKPQQNRSRSVFTNDVLHDVEKKEQERLKEIEIMQRTEEEFRQKRSRYHQLYYNNQQNFRKAMLSVGEKSV